MTSISYLRTDYPTKTVKIAILKESRAGENRVSVTPTVVKSLIGMGLTCLVESGAGVASHYSDSEYAELGASIESRTDCFAQAEALVQINPPISEDIQRLKVGQLWISMVYHRSNMDVVEAINSKGASLFSLDAIPRISRAQSMDVLSSQANLAGYRAVIEGA